MISILARHYGVLSVGFCLDSDLFVFGSTRFSYHKVEICSELLLIIRTASLDADVYGLPFICIYLISLISTHIGIILAIIAIGVHSL